MAPKVQKSPVEDGDSLESGIVNFAVGGKLRKRVHRLLRSKPETGLPVVFKRGSDIVKRYPDGREEKIGKVPARSFKIPAGVKVFGPPQMTPRIRMFAGPNGSGKTSLIESLVGKFSFGYLLNPDRVESDLQASANFDFHQWGVNTDEPTLRAFFDAHPLGKDAKAAVQSVDSNILKVNLPPTAGYFAAVLCDFIRKQWLAAKTSFTFETVMSSNDKVDLLHLAQQGGFRTYLYYVCTDSPLINQNRVEKRVREGGHSVPTQKITERYHRTLTLLAPAIALANRAYMFDNSGGAHRLVAEFEDGKLHSLWRPLPDWFMAHAVLESV